MEQWRGCRRRDQVDEIGAGAGTGDNCLLQSASSCVWMNLAGRKVVLVMRLQGSVVAARWLDLGQSQERQERPQVAREVPSVQATRGPSAHLRHQSYLSSPEPHHWLRSAQTSLGSIRALTRSRSAFTARLPPSLPFFRPQNKPDPSIAVSLVSPSRDPACSCHPVHLVARHQHAQ
jgi:hypothetical protein